MVRMVFGKLILLSIGVRSVIKRKCGDECFDPGMLPGGIREIALMRVLKRGSCDFVGVAVRKRGF